MKHIKLWIPAVVLAVIGCGCGTAEYHQDEQYAASVRQLVDDAVKYTRIMEEKDKDFHCYDSASVKEYTKALDHLSGIYQKILMLQPSDKFDDNDRSLKESARQVLSVTSDIKTHVRYASENADDTLFLKEKQELFEQYRVSYEELTYASQYIQTFWRNA